MAKTKSRKMESANPSSTKNTKTFNAISDSYDPALASLFASSVSIRSTTCAGNLSAKYIVAWAGKNCRDI